MMTLNHVLCALEKKIYLKTLVRICLSPLIKDKRNLQGHRTKQNLEDKGILQDANLDVSCLTEAIKSLILSQTRMVLKHMG